MQTQRTNYNGDRHAYNGTQRYEAKMWFLVLLNRLLEAVEEPEKSRGGTRLPLRDVLFGCIYKVYHGWSPQWFVHELRMVAEIGLISCVPASATLNRYMADPAMTSMLKELVVASSLPLIAVETSFAVDSTVFANSQCHSVSGLKDGHARRARIFLKVHMISGRKTGIVGAAEVAEADEVGTLPLEIPPSNVVPVGLDGSAWARISHKFGQHLEHWESHYSRRSNAESTMQSIKRRFGSMVRARTHVGQTNELYCKVIAHNLDVLAYAMYDRGIDPTEFGFVVLDTPPNGTPPAMNIIKV